MVVTDQVRGEEGVGGWGVFGSAGPCLVSWG